MNPIKCKFAEVALNLDMSGRVSPCHAQKLYLNDENGNPIILQNSSLRSAWTSPNRKDFLDRLAKGEQHPACSYCWETEAHGGESLRLKMNKELADLDPHDKQPRILIMKHGNKCNNACRMCSPFSSSLWYKDWYKMNESKINKPYKEWLKNFESFEKSFDENNLDIREVLNEWNENLVFIDLYGGEPLLNKLTYEIIDKSITNGHAKDQVIGIHTNLTIFDQDLIDKFSQFKKVDLGMSIDAIGIRNDYIRQGSKWEVIETNLFKFIDYCKNHPNVVPLVCATAMTLNVYYMDELFEYFHSRGIPLSMQNRVYDKKEYNISYIPRPIKEKIKEKLSSFKPKTNSGQWKHELEILLGVLSYDPPDLKIFQDSFWKKNRELDVIRGQDFAKVFPEYAQLWIDYYNNA